MSKEEIKTMINSGEMYDDTHSDVAKARNWVLAMCRKYNKKVNDNHGLMRIANFCGSVLMADF